MGTNSGLIAPIEVRFASNVAMVRSFVDHFEDCRELLLQPGLDKNVDQFENLRENLDKFNDYLLIAKPIANKIVIFEGIILK